MPSLIALDCVQTPPTLTKKNQNFFEYFLRGGGVCTQAIIELVFINMNSPSHNSLICTCFHLSALEFTYIRLVSPICTCLTHMLYPHLCALSFGYVRLTSNVDSLFHLHALLFTYTPLVSSSVCTSRYFSALFVSYIRACLHLYALAFTYVQFSDRVFSDSRILVGHILRRLCCIKFLL